MTLSCLRAASLFVLVAWRTSASVLYVDLNSPSPAVPYASWNTAARNIQQAVNAASTGDLVLVTNGLYKTGGAVVSGSLTNRVAVTKALVLQSVNGPAVTIIEGNQVPGNYGDGDGAVRCVFLADNAVLIGFTLTNGATRTSGEFNLEQCGAGLWCSPGAVASNCVLVGNSAWNFGGAAFHGTLNNCSIISNLAYRGGAAISATLNNCLIVSNWAERLGGAVSDCSLSNCKLTGNSGWNGGGGWYSTFNNCILSGNSAGTGGGGHGCTFNNCTLTGNSAVNSGGGALNSTVNNSIVYNNNGGNYDSSCTFSYSCTTPAPGGTANTASEPLFVNAGTGDLHLQSNSPCINTGTNVYASATNDFDANARIVDNVVDMGAYEFQAAVPFIVSIEANGTNTVSGYSLDFAARFLGGLATATRWDFGDGTSVSNQFSVSHSWAAAGVYPVVLKAFNASNPGGISSTVTVHVVQQTVRYVALNSPNPTWPYTNWSTAAQVIQDAIDAASSGDLVLVSNGVYNVGGNLAPGSPTTNRAAVTKILTLLSINGPATTVIDGAGVARCAYLADGAVLAGFTLTNGTTSDYGGGVRCASTSVAVSNCVFLNNLGGAYQGTFSHCVFSGGATSSSRLANCLLTNNNDGAAFSTLNNCTFAGNNGRSYYCNFTNCIVTGNPGGAAFRGTFSNCTLTGNGNFACSGATLYNCTVVGNTNGLYDSLAYNCIVFYNDTQGGVNHVSDGELNPSGLYYCCTTPLPNSGVGNITNEPAFVNLAAGDLHLQANSPCINAGNNPNAASPPDFDGNPRIKGGTVDLGAYEYQTPSSVLSYAWAQQFGLPTDGTADYSDPDGDRMNNWQEWRAATSPLDSASALKMLTPGLSNNPLAVLVSWQSSSGINYYLQRCEDLSSQPVFVTIQSNIVGQIGITSFTDTNVIPGRPSWYRVGVQ